MDIFVAKLNPGTSEVNLREAFSQFGEVTQCKVVMDRETGRSKCYGFVSMSDQTDGMAAIQGLNNSDLDGNRIVVKESEPRSRPQRY